MKKLLKKERLEAYRKHWMYKMDKKDRNGKRGRLEGIMNTL